MIELVYPAGPAPMLRGCNLSKSAEMLPIVDENGYVTAQAARSCVHDGSKPLHPVVHLHVLNRNAELFLQQRGAHKEIFPLYWDTAVGGHVSYGEQILEALYREAGEELGSFEFNPHSIQSYVFESKIERELVNVFAAVGDFRLAPDPDELAGGRWWSMDEIESSMGKGVLTPNFEGEFRQIKNQLLSLL